jgi:O-antigen ligase
VSASGTRVGSRERTIRFVLLWSAVLGSLVDTGGVTTDERAAALIVIAIGVVAALPGGLRTTMGAAVALWAFVLVTVASYLRGVVQPLPLLSARVMLGLAIMLFLVALLGFFAMLAPMSEATRRARLRCVLFSPVVFTMLNLALYLVGFHLPTTTALPASGSPPSNGAAEVLGLLGIGASRASLPLTAGIDGAGAIAALSLVVCVFLAGRNGPPRSRRFALAGLVCSIVTILLVDSRGPLVWAVIALALMAALPWLRRGIGALPLALPFAPAIILFVLGKLGAFSATFSRGTSTTTDFVSATGREQVWSIIINFLSHINGELIYGWGAYGQARSGVSYRYAYLFAGQPNPQFFSAHNVVLQIILDTGLIGLVFFLWLLVKAISGAFAAYQASGLPESKALLGGLIVISLLGSDEAVPGVATISLLILLLLMVCAAIRSTAPVRARLPVRTAQLVRA